GKTASVPWTGNRACGLAGTTVFMCSGSCAVTRSTVHDFLGGGFGAFPALNLDPLALLEIFVVLEEMLNLAAHFLGNVFDRAQAAVGGIQFVDGHGQKLGVAAGFVFHLEQAQRTTADHCA